MPTDGAAVKEIGLMEGGVKCVQYTTPLWRAWLLFDIIYNTGERLIHLGSNNYIIFSADDSTLQEESPLQQDSVPQEESNF